MQQPGIPGINQTAKFCLLMFWRGFLHLYSYRILIVAFCTVFDWDPLFRFLKEADKININSFLFGRVLQWNHLGLDISFSGTNCRFSFFTNYRNNYAIGCHSLWFWRLLSKVSLSCWACLFPGHLVRWRRLSFLLCSFVLFFSFCLYVVALKFTSFSSVSSGIKRAKRTLRKFTTMSFPCVRVPACLSPSLTFSGFCVYVMYDVQGFL